MPFMDDAIHVRIVRHQEAEKRSFVIALDSGDTIGRIRERITAQEGYERFNLGFGGRFLEPDSRRLTGVELEALRRTGGPIMLTISEPEARSQSPRR